jgi:hypothetical protein
MKIKLGKLPNTTSVRMTVVIPEELKQQLERYAKFHSATWNHPVDAALIIPQILAQFLANDRAFRQTEWLSKCL